MRKLITLEDLTHAEIERIFAIADDLKSKFAKGVREALLPGRVMALLFEKPSLRTRVSFETSIVHLGGSSLFLGQDVGWGGRESTADFGRVLSEYVDVIVVRSHAHQRVVDLAKYCACSVINGLTDMAHPCQALADLFTIRELLGKLDGVTIAYIGDGNNVARSLAEGAATMGMKFVMATPKGYEFDPAFVARLKKARPNFEPVWTTDPREAARQANVIYTDVWTSMGQESETEERKRVFAPYQVNAALMAAAPKDCHFMHCLPAHRGEEVTDEVIDGAKSIVVRQAANRLHAQKGILAWLLGAKA